MANLIGLGREVTADHNTIYFHEDDDARVAKLEMWIAKNIGEHLMKVYPRRRWEVIVDIPGRSLIVKYPTMSNTHGYHLDMKLDNIEVLKARAVTAGGEIMERFGLSRRKDFDPDTEEDLARDVRDDVIPVTDSMLGEDPMKH